MDSSGKPTYYRGDQAAEMCDRSNLVFGFPRTADSVVKTGWRVDGADTTPVEAVEPIECKVIITESKYACEVSEAWVPLVEGVPQPAMVDWLWMGLKFNVLKATDSEYGIDASDPWWYEEAAAMSDENYDEFDEFFYDNLYESDPDMQMTSLGDTCPYANDDYCDEPEYCPEGTDCTDCGTCEAAEGDAAPPPR